MSEQAKLTSLLEKIKRARSFFVNGLTTTIFGTIMATLGVVYWHSGIAIVLGVVLCSSGGYIMLCYDIRESHLTNELKRMTAQLLTCPGCGKSVQSRNLVFCPFCGKPLV